MDEDLYRKNKQTKFSLTNLKIFKRIQSSLLRRHLTLEPFSPPSPPNHWPSFLPAQYFWDLSYGSTHSPPQEGGEWKQSLSHLTEVRGRRRNKHEILEPKEPMTLLCQRTREKIELQMEQRKIKKRRVLLTDQGMTFGIL